MAIFGDDGEELRFRSSSLTPACGRARLLVRDPVAPRNVTDRTQSTYGEAGTSVPYLKNKQKR